jgi:hypothetical protein
MPDDPRGQGKMHGERRSADILKRLARKGSNKERLAAQVIGQPELLPEVLDGLSAGKADVKYGCAKILRIISEQAPAVLYPQLDLFVALLDSDNKILKWNAIFIIGKIDRVLGKYLQPLRGPELVTAANVIGGAARIALAKPRLADTVAGALLTVSRARYRTPECRHVALGQVIEAFDQMYDRIEHKEPVIRLVKRQLKSPRNATRKKAQRFVQRRLSPGSSAA